VTSNFKRKICIVVGSRANYSSIKSVMRAVQEHSELQLQVVAAASAVLDRYGKVVELIKEDGFPISAEVPFLVEGETPLAMAKSTGLGLIDLSNEFNRLQPDFVVTVGDRYETMSTVLAAAYMNIPVVHTMGGEVTGTIDESVRHAVTKFSHVHFPASRDASERIVKLGEKPEDVHMVGCPRIDLVAMILNEMKTLKEEEVFTGVGNKFDLNKPFILVSQHPVTTEYGSGIEQITETLKAVEKTGLPALILWPNADAGSEDISRGMRIWRENHSQSPFYYVKNLPIDIYVRLMKTTACLVGNSSSGIREGAFIGTPVVNIGSRQNARERGMNVIDVNCICEEIYYAIQSQIKNGPYAMDPIYGDGTAGHKVADILSRTDIEIQKQITY
jgi:UDP-hydrolysing UDP-N-acetyl-D-glucosamine 2-epimerase